MLDLTSKAMLAASIRHGMFASRDTVDEALNYAVETIQRVSNDDRAAVYTALHVVMNTIADKIMALPDSSAAEPEPSAAARIDHADLPATGEQSLNEKIADIVDQRILYHSAALNQMVERKVEKAIEEWSENAPFDSVIEEWFDDNVDIETSVKDYLDEHLDESIRESLSNLDLKIKITN